MTGLCIKPTVATVCAIILTMALGGCGTYSERTTSSDTDAPTFSSSYATEFKRAWEDAKTQLAKDVLKDGKVSDAEMQEVADAMNTCVSAYGLSYAIDDTGSSLGQVRGTLSDKEMLKVQDQCAAKTDLWTVESLWSGPKDNPNNLQGDDATAVYDCLNKHDLLPQPITKDEYLQMQHDEADPDLNDTDPDRKWAMDRTFRVYMEVNNETNQPNPDYDREGAQQFWACNSDPIHQ